MFIFTEKKISLLLVVLATLMINGFVSANVASKAMQLRFQSMNSLVFMESPMANFGTEEQNKFYENIKTKYSRSLAFLFEKNYLEAYRSFFDVQADLERLYQEVSLAYITRASQLLQVGVNDLVKIDITYHRSADKIQKILTDIEPPYEKPLYDPQEFHFTYNKYYMNNNMDKGFEYLGYSKLSRQLGIDLEKYFVKKTDMNERHIQKKINHFKVSIQLARKAKVNAIEVMRITRKYYIQKSRDEYLADYPGHIRYDEKNLRRTPILDKRIPEEYVVDANDSLNKINTEEKKYILDLINFDQAKYKKDLNPNLNR